MGKAHQGRGLESCVGVSQRGIVAVEKMEAFAKWKFNSKTRKVELTAEAGPVDWVGTVCGTGRSIHFDTKEGSIPTRFDIRPVLTDKQRKHLITQGRAGAIAGLLIEAKHPSRQRFFWLPWEALVVDEASVKWEDPRLVDLGSARGPIDFRRIPGVVPPPAAGGAVYTQPCATDPH